KSLKHTRPKGGTNIKTMSYVRSLHHIIIRTKYSKQVFPEKHAEELYRYIWGFIKNKKSFLYRINGTPNHIHILVSLHATLALSDFVKTLKTSTNSWLKTKNQKFPDFQSWGKRYAAFSIRYEDKDTVINYIKNQREHHKHESFQEEYRRLILE